MPSIDPVTAIEASLDPPFDSPLDASFESALGSTLRSAFDAVVAARVSTVDVARMVAPVVELVMGASAVVTASGCGERYASGERHQDHAADRDRREYR